MSSNQLQCAATVSVVRYLNAALQQCSRQHASCSDAFVLDQWEALVLWNASKAEVVLQQVHQNFTIIIHVLLVRKSSSYGVLA
jgi:hypothetical protein